MTDKSLQAAKPAPQPKPGRKPGPTSGAVKMTSARVGEAFPAGDPRAGQYEYRTYLVPEEVGQDVAEALVSGGNYEWTERPAPPAGE